MSSRQSMLAKAPWLLLAVPCLILIVAAFNDQRPEWRQLREGEATRIMQAESLRSDGDLQFETLDFERHVVTRYGVPGDLALVSGNEGRSLTFDASLPPTLVMMLGLWLFGEFGFQTIQALFLAAALLFAAWRLHPRLGPAAPAWLAVLAFGSVAFSYVFHGTEDLTLFALVLIAAALVAGPQVTRAPKPGAMRPASALPRSWLLAGLLLSVAVFSHWQNLLLLMPFLAVAGLEKDESQVSPASSRLGLIFGMLGGFTLQALLTWFSGGGLGLFDSAGFVFSPQTGFPLVDFDTEHWSYTLNQLSSLHFTGAARFSWGLEPRLVAWNGLYLLLGQSIGLVTYGVAPLGLLLFGSRRRPLVTWLVGVGLWCAAQLIFQPFDLFGGAGATGNRLFLPWLAASVLVWSKPRERFRSTASVTAMAAVLLVLSSPLLLDLWKAPAAPPSLETEVGTSQRHVSSLARRHLPYELSQQPLPGGAWLDHRGLRVRLLDEHLSERRLDVFAVEGSELGTLWVASPEPLESLILAFGSTAPSTLELSTGRQLDRILRPDGGIDFRLEAPARHHGMWWSPRPQWLYRLTFRLPDAKEQVLEFHVTGEVSSSGEGS